MFFCQCLREKNEAERRLLDPAPFSSQRNPTDDQKLIKLLQEELGNYVSNLVLMMIAMLCEYLLACLFHLLLDKESQFSINNPPCRFPE